MGHIVRYTPVPFIPVLRGIKGDATYRHKRPLTHCPLKPARMLPDLPGVLKQKGPHVDAVSGLMENVGLAGQTRSRPLHSLHATHNMLPHFTEEPTRLG